LDVVDDDHAQPLPAALAEAGALAAVLFGGAGDDGGGRSRGGRTGGGAEISGRVRRAIAGLPPRDREVVVLFYLEGNSAEEVGRLTGDTANAVQVRLSRARRKLDEVLAPLVKE
jgi:DNA-directed RNA polymerase specialized sigma24 family protein